MINDKFLDVMRHEGPATIVLSNIQPACIVSTWMSYIDVNAGTDTIYIPAAGMHTIENGLTTDDHLVVTVGSKEVQGTQGPGAGFYIYGIGTFIDEGTAYLEMKQRFPWLRKVLKVDINKIEQKI